MSEGPIVKTNSVRQGIIIVIHRSKTDCRKKKKKDFRVIDNDFCHC